jgi:hypothetical protein
MKIPKIKVDERTEKIQQHIQNAQEMLNHQIYCLFIALADLRHELQELSHEIYAKDFEDKK